MAFDSVPEIRCEIENVSSLDEYNDVNIKMQALVDEFNNPDEYLELQSELKQTAYNKWVIGAAVMFQK